MLQCCGASRFAYNTCLAKWNEDYESSEQVKHNRFSIKKWFNSRKNDDFPWVYEYSKWIYEAAIQDLDKAFKNFFKGNCNHPKFHKKGIRDSFRIDGSVVKIDGKHLKLPKSQVYKMAEELRYDAEKIYNVTVSKVVDMWFASISCEVPDQPRESQSGCVGIDLGLKELATLSDGTVIENPRWLRRRERRQKHLQRELARKKKGSKNHKKAKLKLARYQYRTACMRQDYMHKSTTKIANEYEVVFLEDLNVRGMVKNHHLAKSVADASFGEFLRQLEYKTNVARIDRFYPSSKTCSCCGHVQDMPLSRRVYECPSCGMSLDRDLNASINILNVGMANYPEVMPVEGVEVKQFYFDWLAERSAKQESNSKSNRFA